MIYVIIVGIVRRKSVSVFLLKPHIFSFALSSIDFNFVRDDIQFQGSSVALEKITEVLSL